ncbi:MAG: DHH family phosphoesterase [Chitinophagaceae bacterium]|nr:DHH family phosphoesterase [Chitinophagaceae bacterium]MBK8605714.1 DHH family phosphoesterase [Chitinophagaceae bacterium]MBP6477347.1 DHH family phosphoesterase [Chitinophagaceae bacterium]MBP7107545.1 DHH family phosphoesterase [Chitinophagaceae bacterium]HQV55053.1 DHH family phosphoesterase [Chitinophagaceae bacterium]
MKAIKEIFPLLSSPRKVVITTHQKPDADAMGSSLALYHFLTGFGHSVTVISPTNWAGWVDWMPGARLVLDYEKNRVKADAIMDDTDWLFCLDFNIFHRTKSMTDKLKDLACTKILIDHHQEPDSTSFTFGISDTSKSSTCEMIYDFIVDSGNADKLTMEINECIYAGVVADTGSFRFSSTHAGVHTLVADLKTRGLDHGKVHEKLFDNFLENRLRFTGNVLLNRMEVFYEYNTALVAIPKADLIKYQIKTGDSEGLVNFPLSIQGIKLVALVIDRDEERKWSFRSKGEFDCNTFARKYFEGGGHYNASGGRSSESLDEAVENFKKAMIENKNLLQ